VFWITTAAMQRRCTDLLDPLLTEPWNSPKFQKAWRALKQHVESMPEADLESFGDALSRTLFGLSPLPDNLGTLLLDPILSAFKRSIESPGEARKAAALAKYQAMRGVSLRFTAETVHAIVSDETQSLSEQLFAQLGSDPESHEQEAKKCFDEATQFLSGHVIRERFADEEPPADEMVEALVPELLAIARRAQEFNPYFGVTLCAWLQGLMERFDEDRYEREMQDVAAIERDSLACCLTFESRSKLHWLEFKSLADQAFRHIYEWRDVARGRELAARALECGTQLWERTTRNTKKAELVDAISPICRFSGNADLVATWLERARQPIQVQAEHCEAIGDLGQAAHLYSQVAFRTFVAAEFAQATRLYTVATYFFDKAHFCWRHVESTGSKSNYRLFEARGFSTASAARRNLDIISATEQFGDAAQYFDRAKRMAWETDEMGLFASQNFYDSAAHFFLALSCLYRAASAESADSFLLLCLHSSSVVTKCFSGFRSVFKSYGELLKYCVSPDWSDGEALRVHLIGNLYPWADTLVATAERIKGAIGREDPRPHILELAKSLLFIDPRG
jgi:hypothetical protein